MLQILGLSRKAPDRGQALKNASVPVGNTPDSGAAPPVAAAETSSPVNARTQSVLPRLFVPSSYVAAVRTVDGAILSRGVAARPADAIELYGTGFASTARSADEIAVSIADRSVDVRFAGYVGPSLYQIDIVVPPDLPGGDHRVVVAASGMECEGLLKVAAPPEVWNDSPGRYAGFVERAAAEGTLEEGTGA